MKFIKLTQIGVLTPVIVAVDHIVEVYETVQGTTVIGTANGDTCVAESVDMVWDKLSGIKQEEKTHRWEVLAANEYGKYEFFSGHDSYREAAQQKSSIEANGGFALIASHRE